MNEIPYPEPLPLRVAIDVVLQGLRIRLGRSMVTLSGVVLGVAFLMSILTGIVLKAGVADEDALRAEVRRMRNLLEAEIGVVDGRALAVIPLGPVAAAEQRLLQRLDGEGAQLRIHDPHDRLPAAIVERHRMVDPAAIGDGASAVLLLGPGSWSESGLAWEVVLAGARQRVVAVTDESTDLPAGQDLSAVRLSRSFSPEELAARAQRERTARFRDIWIIAISVVVMVIGIANAMLMSVTERFREIGTMKCLGALSSFVRRLFMIESAIMGLVGGIIGCLGGLLFSMLAYGITYGPELLFSGLAGGIAQLAISAIATLVIGLALAMVAAWYPAKIAARMVPAHALRSTV